MIIQAIRWSKSAVTLLCIRNKERYKQFVCEKIKKMLEKDFLTRRQVNIDQNPEKWEEKMVHVMTSLKCTLEEENGYQLKKNGCQMFQQFQQQKKKLNQMLPKRFSRLLQNLN